MQTRFGKWPKLGRYTGVLQILVLLSFGGRLRILAGYLGDEAPGLKRRSVSALVAKTPRTFLSVLAWTSAASSAALLAM
jgi:hypothetical protein